MEGVDVRSCDQVNAKLPSINIAFLNMMPDAALAATERQFLRLIGSNTDVNCYFYPFTIEGVERSDQVRNYVDEFYFDYDLLQAQKIDALIITGANVKQPLLQNELFWPELTQVLTWAKRHVRSILCSCLATHAAIKVFYDIDRQHLGEKCWGVFEHQVLLKEHELVNLVSPNLQMCHSRFNDISKEKFINHNIEVLIESNQVGVQLAVEKDMSVVYFQGHPEYDDISLLKEYKREIARFLAGEVSQYPVVPLNYFDAQAMEYVNRFRSRAEHADNSVSLLDGFPEGDLKLRVKNLWNQAARQIFANWINILVNESF